MVRINYLIMLGLFVCPSMVFSQGLEKYNFDFGLGVTYLHGDVKSAPKSIVNADFKYLPGKVFSFSASLKKGTFFNNSPDARRQFRNEFLEGSAEVEIDLINLLRSDFRASRVSVIGSGGIGFIQSRTTDLRERRAEDASIQNFNYEGNNIVIPVGGTVEYYVSPSASFFIDVGASYANTDKLDNYWVKSEANQAKDVYSYYIAGFSLKFGNNFQIVEEWTD